MNSFLKKYKQLIIAVLVILVILVIWLIRRSEIQHSIHVVRPGTFERIIEAKGEIHGKNSIKITLDDIFKDPDIQIWEYAIKDMAPEGTILKKGDWVATLDQVNLNQRLQINREEMDVRLALLNDAIIDSAIALSQIRQRISELEFNLQYRTLDLEQSKYESPAYQRRMLTAYNQTLREIERQKREYQLRKMDVENRTQRNERWYNHNKDVDEKLQRALEATTIKAPEDGMLIYARTRWNRKIKVGDEVGPWRPIIATLPDLSVLVSETFVEEVDIAKIRIGDSVLVNVDALPGNQYTGIIVNIANIGQELQNVDSKVFSVTIELNQQDTKLLPGMTSNNRIITEKIPNQLIIPRRCLFVDSNQTFVYLKKEGKVWKNIVKTGPENDEVVVIKNGLAEKDRILTQPPETGENVKERKEQILSD